MVIKAILFDYIGTLVEPRNYYLEDSKTKLHEVLCQAGLPTDKTEFMEAYTKAHEKYRAVRYGQLREVTNAVWVSEALNNIRCKVTLEDERLKTALNSFFQDFIDSLRLRPHAKELIKKAAEHCRVGLVSNFTYAPAIYASLRKLRIDRDFSAIIVSESLGYRKPHAMIFEEALRLLQAKPIEGVFVGDSPSEDIDGAKKAGLHTVFVASRFNTLQDLEDCAAKPDYIFEDLVEICEKLPEIVEHSGMRRLYGNSGLVE